MINDNDDDNIRLNLKRIYIIDTLSISFEILWQQFINRVMFQSNYYDARYFLFINAKYFCKISLKERESVSYNFVLHRNINK